MSDKWSEAKLPQNTSSKDRSPVLCLVRTGPPSYYGGQGGPGTPSGPPGELESVRLISIGQKSLSKNNAVRPRVGWEPRSLPLYFRAPETLLSLPTGQSHVTSGLQLPLGPRGLQPLELEGRLMGEGASEKTRPHSLAWPCCLPNEAQSQVFVAEQERPEETQSRDTMPLTGSLRPGCSLPVLMNPSGTSGEVFGLR